MIKYPKGALVTGVTGGGGYRKFNINVVYHIFPKYATVFFSAFKKEKSFLFNEFVAYHIVQVCYIST